MANNSTPRSSWICPNGPHWSGCSCTTLSSVGAEEAPTPQGRPPSATPAPTADPSGWLAESCCPAVTAHEPLSMTRLATLARAPKRAQTKWHDARLGGLCGTNRQFTRYTNCLTSPLASSEKSGVGR